MTTITSGFLRRAGFAALAMCALPAVHAQECPGGEPGIECPSYPPSPPNPLEYPSYTNGTGLSVAWSPSYIDVGGIVYQLEESTDNGGWVSVYQGYDTSTYLDGKSKSLLSYRARACSDLEPDLCSDYANGPTTAINPSSVVNLYEKYPILYGIDQRVAQYRASAPSFPTVIPRAPVPGQGGATARIMGSGERFYLGDGYDVIRGALKEVCLDVDHTQFVINQSPPLQPSTFSVDHVNDNRHLAQLLEVSASAQVGLTTDDFTLGLSAEKERYRRSVTDETHERFVVKWVTRAQLWRLSTPVDAIIPGLTNQVLQPGSNDAKADFRERCGDKFINTANVGAALYLVFDYDTKKFDYQEREAKKATVGLKIQEIFGANGAGSISSDTQQLFNELHINIHADQVGGPPGIAATITKDNFNAKYNEFIQGTNASNWAAVDFTTTSYQRPTVYSGYPYADIFADFTEPFAQARRWLDLTVQQKERCDPYTEHGRIRPAQCGTSETELGIVLDLCRETRDWALCQHPTGYYTAFSTFPGTNLLGWLSGNVKKLEPADVEQSYTHHVFKGSLDVNDPTCLRHSQCFASRFRGTGIGLGRGFTVTVDYYDNPKGSGPTYYLSSLNQCVTARAHLQTRKPPFGDTTADFNYTMQLEGFCAESQPFVVVP